MRKYDFYTDQFGIDDKGIHLLRGNFNYKSIELKYIKSILIKKGRQVNNWILLLLFGITLMLFGLYGSAKVIYEYFFAHNIQLFYVEQFLVPVIPLLLGIYSVYQSLRIGLVLRIETNNSSVDFYIGNLKPSSRVNDLIFVIKNNPSISSKLKIELL